MNYCPNCGKEVKEGEKFCPNCGKDLSGNNINVNVNINQNKGRKIYERNIVTAILLSIFTCGIYGIYWLISLTDDANYISEQDNETSGGMVFLLTLITCGIYGIYWAYKMGKTLQRAGEINGLQISDNSILYLILEIFGFAIVNYAIMQNELNKIANVNR